MSNDQNPAAPRLGGTWRAYLSYCNDRTLDRLSDFVHYTICFNGQDVALTVTPPPSTPTSASS